MSFFLQLVTFWIRTIKKVHNKNQFLQENEKSLGDSRGRAPGPQQDLRTDVNYGKT